MTMLENETPAETDAGIVPGAVVVIDTAVGPRAVQVTHARSPYPEVVRALAPGPGTGDAAGWAARPTAFAVMAELSRAIARGDVAGRVIGHAPVPDGDRAFPTFHTPIRDRTGAVVYWWAWDGEGLSIASEAGEAARPLREITGAAELRDRLAAL